MGVEELYITGEFSDTESDRYFQEQAEKSRVKRFERKVEHIRENNDLTTVKESPGGENYVMTLPDNQAYTASPNFGQSFVSKRATGKLDYRPYKSNSGYNSFNLK